MGTAKVIMILFAYILLMVGIGLSPADGVRIQVVRWLGVMESVAARRYAELVIFSGLVSYLFYRLTRDMLFGEIQRAYLRNELQWHDARIKKAKEAGDKTGDYNAMKTLRDDKVTVWTRHEKRGEKKLQWIMLGLAFVGPIVTAIIEHFLRG